MHPTLRTWLDAGDAPESDWADHVLHLALSDGLGRAGDDLLLDLPALAQPYACRSVACAPDTRGPRTSSCCADLQVGLSPAEAHRLHAALPDLADRLRDEDPRWAHGPPAIHHDGTLTRPDGRCVFALRGPRGLRCALHQLEDDTGRPRGALKPMPCRLFPLIVVALDDGRALLSAVARRTARRVGAPAAARFPCLSRDPTLPPVLRNERETVTALFGPDVYAAARREVLGWRRRQR